MEQCQREIRMLVEAGYTHEDVSNFLRSGLPLETRGLSVRSMRHFVHLEASVIKMTLVILTS